MSELFGLWRYEKSLTDVFEKIKKEFSGRYLHLVPPTGSLYNPCYPNNYALLEGHGWKTLGEYISDDNKYKVCAVGLPYGKELIISWKEK